MSQKPPFLKEREKAIRKATLAAVNQAREQRRAAIEAACSQEKEKCRMAFKAVEELENQLKHAADESEKAALRQAIKESKDDMRQVISQAKKEAEAQKQTAVIREKEMVARIKEEEKTAIASLAYGDTVSEEGFGKEALYSDGIYDSEFITGNQDLESMLEKSPPGSSGFDAGGQAGNPGLREIDFPVIGAKEDEWENTDEQTGQAQENYIGYDEIRRALEENVRKLEEERRARMDFDLPQVPMPAPKNLFETENINNEEETKELMPDVLEDVRNTTSNDALEISEKTEDLPEKPEEKREAAILHEGKVMITIQNAPSSRFVRHFGEKLKQIDDMRILLLGGSSDAGLQFVVLAQKPIPLIERILQLAQVEVVSYTMREIYLKHKPDSEI